MVHILDTKRRGYEKTPRDGYFKGHTSRIRTGYSATTPEPDNHSLLDTGLNLSLLPFLQREQFKHAKSFKMLKITTNKMSTNF